MNVRRFQTLEELTGAVVALMSRHFSAKTAYPHAVMISGGNTPLPAYGLLAHRPVTATGNVHVLFSDERLVPMVSLESNYGHAREMIAALGIPGTRVIRVRTELPLLDAAARYHRDLEAFISGGGRVSLGLLGLGADGHTASLFSADDVARGKGRWAISVARDKKPDRVSVTADFLSRVESVVFLVSGPDKAAALDQLIQKPATIPAGQAVAGTKDVNLWISP